MTTPEEAKRLADEWDAGNPHPDCVCDAGWIRRDTAAALHSLADENKTLWDNLAMRDEEIDRLAQQVKKMEVAYIAELGRAEKAEAERNFWAHTASGKNNEVIELEAERDEERQAVHKWMNAALKAGAERDAALKQLHGCQGLLQDQHDVAARLNAALRVLEAARAAKDALDDYSEPGHPSFYGGYVKNEVWIALAQALKEHDELRTG